MNHLSHRVQIILQEMPGKDHGKQSRLASIAGASKQVISHWVNGVVGRMDYEYATMIHERLGYRLEWLITGKGPMRDEEGSNAAVEAESVEPVAGEKPPQGTPVSEELFLERVTIDEMRLLSAYRKGKRSRETLSEIANIFNRASPSDVM